MSKQQAERLAQIRARNRKQKLDSLCVDADLYQEAAVTRVAVASFEPIKAELEKTIRSAVATGVLLANLVLIFVAFALGMFMAGLSI